MDFKDGIAMSAKIAVMAITTIVSIKVKPQAPDFFMPSTILSESVLVNAQALVGRYGRTGGLP